MFNAATAQAPRVVESATPLPVESCDLCGLPMGPGATEATGGGTTHHFCCPGCRQVYSILSASSGALPGDFKNTELYRACVEAGVIPGNLPGPRDGSGAGDSHQPRGEFPALEISFKADGMWCPACAWLIEEVLRRTSGVVQPTVSFFADTVRLTYLPHLIAPEEIMTRVKKLGYGVSAPDDEAQGAAARNDQLRRLAISAILTMNAMTFSAALYFGLFRELSPAVVAYFSLPLLLITMPVIFYGGMPIFRKAWAALLLRAASMDTLIAISALAAFCYSLVQTARSSILVYYDTAAMLVTIVLLGRFIETRARHHVYASMNMDGSVPNKVRVVRDRIEQWVHADAISPGDSFVVKAGERVAIDGRITHGKGLLDQSALTGESTPAALGFGEHVAAGGFVIDGEFTIEATRSFREGSLMEFYRRTREALDWKDSRAQLADSVGRLFAPAILTLTVITGAIMWFLSFPADTILLRCLTILFISCPCALGIAAPLAKVAIIGISRKRGILVTNPGALERMSGLDAIVFDKTGTVTEGRFGLRRVVCGDMSKAEALSLVAPLEVHSPHFLAREIVRQARERGGPMEKADGTETLEGMGVMGHVGGKMVFAGSRRLLLQCGAALPAFLEAEAKAWEKAAMTVVFFGWGKAARGLLVFGDPVRPGARELMDWLQAKGTRVLLLSGDGQETTEAVAASLGIKEYLGQKLPAEKAEIIEQMKRGHLRIGMVGDGVNDAGAMALADVAIAMGTADDLVGKAADLIIPGGRPGAVIDAFALSALTARTIRQNLCFAFLYNATAIPVAAAGLLNPLIAVLAMFMSSLTVIGNALRLSRKNVPGPKI